MIDYGGHWDFLKVGTLVNIEKWTQCALVQQTHMTYPPVEPPVFLLSTNSHQHLFTIVLSLMYWLFEDTCNWTKVREMFCYTPFDWRLGPSVFKPQNIDTAVVIFIWLRKKVVNSSEPSPISQRFQFFFLTGLTYMMLSRRCYRKKKRNKVTIKMSNCWWIHTSERNSVYWSLLVIILYISHSMWNKINSLCVV